MKKTHIIVHHSLVSYDKNPAQYEAIRNFHLRKGWGDKTGYNFVIEKLGKTEVGRSLNSAGTHTKQQKMNLVGIGICLSGNFDIEDPTIEQCKSLYKLINDLMKDHGIPEQNVKPHRHYATYKSCWGSRLPDDIMGYLRGKLTVSVPEWAEEAYKKALKKGVVRDGDDLNEVIGGEDLERSLVKTGVFSKTNGDVTMLRWIVALNRMDLLD
jgi:hypothetical protein